MANLTEETFDKNKGKDVFYVFVLKHETEINYLIIPSLWIDQNADKFDLDKNERWQLYFTPIKDEKLRKLEKAG